VAAHRAHLDERLLRVRHGRQGGAREREVAAAAAAKGEAEERRGRRWNVEDLIVRRCCG
jgi:hypothetical protein